MYSELIGSYTETTTPILRSKYSPNELVCFPYKESTTLYHAFQRGLRLFPNNFCYGERQKREDGTLDEYKWITYTQFWERVKSFGSGILEKKLITNVDGKNLFGIIGRNSINWVVCQNAMNTYNLTLVPIFELLGQINVEYILNNSKIESLLCTPSEVELILSLNKTYCLKNIVLTEDISSDLKKKLSHKFNIYLMTEIESLGSENPMSPVEATSEDICMICYTSGTTGEQKGALIPNRSFLANVAGWRKIGLKYTESDIYLSYLPLSHIMETVVHVAMMQEGGRIGFFSGDSKTILDDVKVLHPTIFASVPRVFNKIYDDIYNQLITKYSMNEINKIIEEKTKNFPKGNYKSKYDEKYFLPILTEMGIEKLRWTQTGGAPMEEKVMNFIRSLFCSPLLEGYGQTETISITFTNIELCVNGQLGGPIPSCEIRLESVPKMNYSVHDRIYDGKPCMGIGEICVRGHGLCLGYNNDMNLNKLKIDSDGWLHTGDIAVLQPNLGIKIVDRLNNIIKLPHGEFVSIELLEERYKEMDNKIIEILLYKEPFWERLVGLIIYKEKIESDELLKRITEKGRKNKNIRGFEILNNVIVEYKPFTVESGYITSTGKKIRRNIHEAYKKRFNEIYKQ